jgi:hypothetical protein
VTIVTRDPAHSGSKRVEDRVLDQGLARRPDGLELLVTAEA